jgi:antitoxin HicB
MRYPVTLTPDRDSGGFLVTFPDVPEAITHGDTEEEALSYAVTALETGILIYIQDGKPVPEPSTVRRGQKAIDLPGLSAAKVALWRLFLRSGKTKYGLAKTLDWHPPQLMRIFDLRHKSKFEQLDQVAAVLGKRLDVTLRDAAD